MRSHSNTALPVWAGRWSFILAATGSTVGLGNVWKFPYLAGKNGGGAFILTYLVCLALVGLPLMIAEVAMGRLARRNPVTAFAVLGAPEKASNRWLWGGRIGVLAGFLILSFYSVVGGLGLAYGFYSAFGDFLGVGPRGVTARLELVFASPDTMVTWHSLFLLLVIVVSSRGITRGLERALKGIVPMMLLLLLVLVIYAASVGQVHQAWQFMFAMRPDQLTGLSVLDALGHAFFTLSLGMGAMLAYGAYMPPDSPVARSVTLVALLDTLVALVAGFVLFAVLFACHLKPESGFTLLFQEVPQAFGALPGGQLLGSVFFVLVSLAAWSSAVSVMEPAVAWLQERTGLRRSLVVWAVGLLAWAAGLISIFSFNLWAGKAWFGMNVFGWVNFLTASVMLPVAGLLVALFSGWVVPGEVFRAHMQWPRGVLFSLWHLLLKYVVPVGVVFVAIASFSHFARTLCSQDGAESWCPAAGQPVQSAPAKGHPDGKMPVNSPPATTKTALKVGKDAKTR